MKNGTNFREKFEHGSEAFPVALYDCGNFAPYHWHPEYEFIYMLSGSATYHIDTNIITLSEGDCSICKGGQLHSIMFKNKEATSAYALVFDLKFLLKDIDICNNFFSEEYLINCKFSACDEKEKLIGDTVKEICEVLTCKSFGYELEVKMLLTKVFVGIFKYRLYRQSSEITEESKIEKILMGTIQHIHTFYYEKISIQSLAKSTGYSLSHFGRLFKASIGKTPDEYIISYRLYKSCELLCNSDKSVLEIALECGFSNVAYFIKTFKKKYGCTPYQYKLRH
jgi:AraC-like DNA-binding protein